MDYFFRVFILEKSDLIRYSFVGWPISSINIRSVQPEPWEQNTERHAQRKSLPDVPVRPSSAIMRHISKQEVVPPRARLQPHCSRLTATKTGTFTIGLNDGMCFCSTPAGEWSALRGTMADSRTVFGLNIDKSWKKVWSCFLAKRNTTGKYKGPALGLCFSTSAVVGHCRTLSHPEDTVFSPLCAASCREIGIELKLIFVKFGE